MSSSPADHRSVKVHFLPEMVHPHALAGHPVVVVDILRASTTIVAATAAGATQVVPCLEVVEARQLAAQRRLQGPVLLGGERGGQLIPGFDLGNSPAEYVPSRVAGRTIVFTTTNGTRALLRCVGAGRVLIGCFANLSAVAQRLTTVGEVHIVCAGTDGEVSWEDSLFAGALVERLLAGWNRKPNDAARVALQAWRQLNGGGALSDRGLAEAFRQGQGGRNLLELQRALDLELAARIDATPLVPELFLSDWSIRDSDA